MTVQALVTALTPDVASAQLVVWPEGPGPGYWAGAPSACAYDGRVYLAYRLRRPVAEGRGHSVVVASSVDGIHFEPLLTLDKEAFGSASLERPALVKGPGDQWMLYVSCATAGSFHWWVDALAATDPREFDVTRRRTVLAGNDDQAVKDPVVVFDGERWLMWACLHPLDDPTATDRMWSRFAVSEEGFNWESRGDALVGRRGAWDQRGARVACVLEHESEWVAFYDGRAGAGDNVEERTGVAVGFAPDRLEPRPGGAVYSWPWGTGSLRYLSLVDDPAGEWRRIYFEACLPDGSHGLFTQAVPTWPLAGASPDRAAQLTAGS